MSDSYLRIVPENTSLIPPKEVASTVVAIVSGSLPEAEEVAAESYGHPVFIDQGANLERIICPACRRRLELGPNDEAIKEWWYQISDDLEGKDVSALTVQMACCGANVPFSAMRFEMPAAIGSFEIAVMNPNVCEPPTGLLDQVAKLLGCPVRAIWAHY